MAEKNLWGSRSAKVSIRIPGDLKRDIVAEAARSGMTTTGWIEFALRYALHESELSQAEEDDHR